MHFKQFTDEFIDKWLTVNDIKELISQKDQKIKAGVNWLSALNIKSYENLDKMYFSLKEKCKECLEKNCKNDYEWIINNSIIFNEDLEENQKLEKLQNLKMKGFENIRFKDENTFNEGIEKIKNFHKNKKLCYEKTNLFRAILIRLSNKWNDELNVCLNICKNKPLDKNTELPDCFSTCMVHKSYEIVNNEFYMKYVFNKLKEEYENNNLTLPKIDLLHSYRFEKRELNDFVVSKFL